MLARRSNGFTLPAYKPRDARRRKKGKKVTPQPIEDEDIISGWTGKEKDKLLAEGDTLPDDVRARI